MNSEILLPLRQFVRNIMCKKNEGDRYAQGQFEKLYPCLADDVVMESQWVLEPNKGKMNVMDYFTGKGKTFRDHDCCPSTALVRLIGNTNPVKSSQVILNGETQPGPASIGIWYEDGKYAMFMSQELEDKTNGALVDLKLNEDGKISRIDLCMPELFRFEIEEELDEDTEIAEELLEMPDEAIETWIHHLLENNPDDFDAIDDFAEAFEDMYGDDMLQLNCSPKDQDGICIAPSLPFREKARKK